MVRFQWIDSYADEWRLKANNELDRKTAHPLQLNIHPIEHVFLLNFLGWRFWRWVGCVTGKDNIFS